MARVTAIANQKGGVGKTTSTVNLAYALTRSGARVLAIDADPQSSLSISLGIDPRTIRELEEAQRTLYYALVKGVPLADLILHLNPDVVPSSIRLANAEAEMLSPYGAATALREALAAVRSQYDHILLDCPPTLSLLTVNALAACDEVLIPVKTDYLSMMGISLLLDTIENVRRRANPELTILGILPTMFNARNVHDQEVLAELREIVSTRNIPIFDPVNRSTVFDKAPVEGKSTLELYPNTPGVANYATIAENILNHAA
jgi:chromosome partitioning protein